MPLSLSRGNSFVNCGNATSLEICSYPAHAGNLSRQTAVTDRTEYISATVCPHRVTRDNAKAGTHTAPDKILKPSVRSKLFAEKKAWRPLSPETTITVFWISRSTEYNTERCQTRVGSMFGTAVMQPDRERSGVESKPVRPQSR